MSYVREASYCATMSCNACFAPAIAPLRPTASRSVFCMKMLTRASPLVHTMRLHICARCLEKTPASSRRERNQLSLWVCADCRGNTVERAPMDGTPLLRSPPKECVSNSGLSVVRSALGQKRCCGIAITPMSKTTNRLDYSRKTEKVQQKKRAARNPETPDRLRVWLLYHAQSMPAP